MTSRRGGLRGLAVVWTASVVLGMADRARGGTGTGTPEDPKHAMVAVLAAPGPHASLGDQARVWDRFVGTWDCDFGFHLPDGTVRHSPGELEFGWVLDGRAIQDLWIQYPKPGEKERGIGTSLRFFDDKARKWHVLFVNPRYPAVLSTEGGLEGDRIVLRGRDTDGNPIRWTFDEIKDDSFTWHGETSHDAGKTWTLEEEHHMRRRLDDGARMGK